ncbi:hypothetical protein KPL74_04755 [Bacillus sp. NP157]|nr:hypothetical protein KPL74_04755 [Bacillus sp. NP157]
MKGTKQPHPKTKSPDDDSSGEHLRALSRDSSNADDAIDLAAIKVSVLLGGPWSAPGGGAGRGGDGQPAYGGGVGGSVTALGNADPRGTHTRPVAGLGTMSASPIFNNQGQVTGAKFGLSAFGNDGALSFQDGGVTFMDSYEMGNNATLSASLSYLNGRYTQSLTGAGDGTFAGVGINASFDSNNHGVVSLNYQAAPGVDLNITVDTTGIAKGAVTATIAEHDGWKVQARSDISSGSWGPTDQVSIFVTRNGPQPQYFTLAVGNSPDRGVYFEAGINIPFY